MHRSDVHVSRSLGLLLTWAAMGAVALPAAALPALAAPVDLRSHRAAYRLSLAEADPASGLTAVRGGLVLEWREDCDGWLSQQRLGFVGSAGEGPGFTYDVRFSSWESRDNTRLRFNVRSFDAAELTEEFRGLAVLEAPGAEGAARYAVPEGKEVELPAGTIFPTAHVQRIIDAARAGEKVVSHSVFDGSGEDALTRVTAVIGAPRQATDESGTETTRWPVSLAYFGYGAQDSLPQFQISFELAETGVLYGATLDYGDFSLKADLEKLEPLEKPVCN